MENTSHRSHSESVGNPDSKPKKERAASNKMIHRTEINESDERDRSDSTTDWDAEQSRTSRNK